MSKISNLLKIDKLTGFEELRESKVRSSGIAREESLPTEAQVTGAVALSPLPTEFTRLGLSELAPLFPFEDSHSAAAEQYRIIRTKVLHHPRQPRLIVVSSASIGDGKTVTSINIAASIALRADRNVLLVDADLRRPRVAAALEIPISPGLSEVVAGRISLESAVVRAEQFPNLYILPAGDQEQNPADLLDSGRWRSLVEQMRARFDMIVVDATPVSVVADYELMQLVSDGIILVIRPGHTNRTACARVLETVPKEKLLGVVLNFLKETWFWKPNSYYRYERKA